MVGWIIGMVLSLIAFGYTDGMLQGFIGLFMIFCFMGFIAAIMDVAFSITVGEIKDKWHEAKKKD